MSNSSLQQVMFNGALLVDKEPNMTSHDAVAITRRQLQFKKIGHCGTLDPFATGLLILVLGKATKRQDAIMQSDKIYSGEIQLGVATNTYDITGEVTAKKELPKGIDTNVIEAVWQSYLGEFLQTPPLFSAIKKNGVPLYKLARKGKQVEVKKRQVTLKNYQFSWQDDCITFRICCSKGFYVRSLAHDIGLVLGCGAHLKSLRREQSGNFNVQQALTAQQLKTATVADILERLIPLSQLPDTQ